MDRGNEWTEVTRGTNAEPGALYLARGAVCRGPVGGLQVEVTRGVAKTSSYCAKTTPKPFVPPPPPIQHGLNLLCPPPLFIGVKSPIHFHCVLHAKRRGEGVSILNGRTPRWMEHLATCISTLYYSCILYHIHVIIIALSLLV